MGIFHNNGEGFFSSLQGTGFWEALHQQQLPYDTLVAAVPENFTFLDDNHVTCDHCGDKFDVTEGMGYLVNHLTNNHAGYIILEEEE